MEKPRGQPGPRRSRKPNLTNEQIEATMIAVLELFFADLGLDQEPLTVEVIAARVLAQTGIELSREQVYRVVSEARRRKLVFFLPPPHLQLETMLRVQPNVSDVRVPQVRGERSVEHVPAMGGHLVYELMKQVARGKKEVHIAFGIGRSTMRCVQRLAELLQADIEPPKFVVHAMSPPFSLPDPLDTPLAALASLTSLLDPDNKKSYVGFPSQPVVPVKEYAAAKRQKFVREAFDKAQEIDIVITSLAAADDEHGYLRQTLDWLAPNARQPGQSGWVGDVHLRPYGATGPIPITQGLKPMTLFELEDLVTLSQTPGKHVVLLVAPCGSCKKKKAMALAPLLREPKLRVFNHLVVDADTAAETLNRLALASGA